jgi:hypothetical protein
MKVTFGVGLAALAATLVVASPIHAAPGARTAAAQPCTPSTSRIDGGPALTFCGPATATLVLGVKTYTFASGLCSSLKARGLELDVTLGTLAEGKSGSGVSGNAGKPYFKLDLSSGRFSALSAAFSGGKEIEDGVSVSFSGSLTSSGTFKSVNNSTLTGKPFSGSWDCHGVFIKN